MNKVTLNIEGMMCAMCEAHINDAIRKVYPEARKVASSRKKGETVFFLDGEADEEILKVVLKETGYEVNAMKTEPSLKKGLFRK